MARTSVEEYEEKLRKEGKTSLDATNKIVTDNAQKNIDLINKNYDAAEQKAIDNYNLRVDDVNQNAADERRTQQAQRIVNERYIAERMASLGLTDSGLNRSQQTGIQLSYANNVSKINQNQQKAIDTLAATMRASLSDLGLERASKVTEVETNRDNTIAQNNATFEQNVKQGAVDLYDADTTAIEKQNTAKANLYSILGDQSKSQSEMTAAINSYALSYGLSDEEQAEFTRLANQTLTDAAASAFAKEAEKEVSSLESFIYSSGNNDKAKYAKIQSAYNKGYISSDQKAYYDSLVSAVSTESSDKFKELSDVLVDPDVSDTVKQASALNYIQTEGVSSQKEAQSILAAAGFDSSQYKLTQNENGELELDFSETALSTPSYTIKKVKNTWNVFEGLGWTDNNDEYEIIDNNTGNVVATTKAIKEDLDFLTSKQLNALSRLNLNETITLDKWLKDDEYNSKKFVSWITGKA